MLRFTPMSDEQYYSSQNPFPEGECEFIVEICEPKVSAGGNQMVVPHISLFSPNSRLSIIIKDYILIDHPTMGFRLRQFYESIDLLEDYKRGEIDLEKTKRRNGRCVIKHEKEKDGNRLFCKVKSYLKYDPNLKISAPVFDDDISF